MKSPNGIDMAEVTRLTRAGHLDQAMDLLRGLRGAPDRAPKPPSAKTRCADVASSDRPDVLDMEPPCAANGDAWTAAVEDARSDKVERPCAPDPLASARRTTLLSTLNRVVKPRIRTGSGASRANIDVPQGARYEKRTYAGAAGSRDYTVYAPSTYAATPRPLVVMLHGCTQTPDDFARGTRMNELAEEQGFLVAYPAQSQAANASKCWSWFNANDQQRDRGEPALIAGITREIQNEFAVDASRVYVAGLSAGGAMAAIMGASYPDLYAAVGVHSGLAPGAANDIPGAFAAMRDGGAAPAASTTQMRGLPTIVFHGEADTTVNPLNADRVMAHARGAARGEEHASAGTSPGGIAYTRTMESDADGRPMLEQWVLHGAGHAWSGGSASGSYVEPRGPDASRAMMRFFAEHANARADG